MGLKVLHIGYGFYPWRGGGLIEYAEDLMEEQVKNGYEVYYFCSGRHYPSFKKTSIKRWKSSKGYLVLEVINPPIYHGGDNGTWFDLESEPIERLFIDILQEIKPDIIHIQELAGLTSSLIEIIKSFKIPCVMTLHDYFLLCPTLKLFDYNHNFCEDISNGNKCVTCCTATPLEIRKNLILNTIRFELIKSQRLYKITKLIYKNFLKKIKLMLLKNNPSTYINSNTNSDNDSNFFLERRNKNIIRLKLIDLLIAQSTKVEKIYIKFLGESNIKTIHSFPKHIIKIKPELFTEIKYPIKFITLSGLASIPKGAILLTEAMKKMEKLNLIEKFELHVYGGIYTGIREEILKFKNVIYHGSYKVNELDKILSNKHVGIMPSVWEEVLGYTGLEMLAKGIPVIGNAKGGIIDYVIDGHTGWINKTSSSDELANIMANIINNPEQIINLNKNIVNNRNSIIKDMEYHFKEIEEEYLNILNKNKDVGGENCLTTLL